MSRPFRFEELRSQEPETILWLPAVICETVYQTDTSKTCFEAMSGIYVGFSRIYALIFTVKFREGISASLDVCQKDAVDLER